MKTKIVIAGGGFGGLYAAKYFDKTLARRDDVEVTLITRENFILFTPMLHESASHSNGYEHALSIVGICSAGDSVSRRCGHGSHTMARRFPAGERCEPLQHGRKLILSLHLC